MKSNGGNYWILINDNEHFTLFQTKTEIKVNMLPKKKMIQMKMSAWFKWGSS